MATQTAPRERDLVAAFLIDIGPPLGALSLFRELDGWEEISAEARAALRLASVEAEREASGLWFGFSRFCRNRLRCDASAVVSEHHQPFMPTWIGVLRSLRPDPVRTAEVERDLDEAWMLTAKCEVA